MTKEGEWNGQQGLKRLAQILHKRAHVMERLLAHSRAVARQLQGAEIQPIRREELPRPEKHGVAGSMGKAKETAANPRVLASIGNPAVKRHLFPQTKICGEIVPKRPVAVRRCCLMIAGGLGPE